MKKVDRTTGRLGIRQRERWLKDYGDICEAGHKEREKDL